MCIIKSSLRSIQISNLQTWKGLQHYLSCFWGSYRFGVERKLRQFSQNKYAIQYSTCVCCTTNWFTKWWVWKNVFCFLGTVILILSSWSSGNCNCSDPFIWATREVKCPARDCQTRLPESERIAALWVLFITSGQRLKSYDESSFTLQCFLVQFHKIWVPPRPPKCFAIYALRKIKRFYQNSLNGYRWCPCKEKAELF